MRASTRNPRVVVATVDRNYATFTIRDCMSRQVDAVDNKYDLTTTLNYYHDLGWRVASSWTDGTRLETLLERQR